MKIVFTAACGDAAAVQGSCRMIDCPDDPALTPEAMLASHRARTPCRMRAQSAVLAIQDGSGLNVATHRACKGLGVIAKTRGPAGTLGLPRIAFEAPGGQADTDKPTADKKAQRWLRGWRDTSRLMAGLANTRVIVVMDRESDVIDLFYALHRQTVDLPIPKRRRSEPGADLVTLTPVHLREDAAPSGGGGARGSNGC